MNKKQQVMEEFHLKKKRLFLLGIGVLFVLLLIFSVNTTKEKNIYEKYLSERIASSITNISEYSYSNEIILQKLIFEKEVSEPEAEQLKLFFQSITKEAHEIEQLGNKINTKNKITTDNIEKVNSEYSEFFLKYDFRVTRNIELSDEEIELLTIMKKLMTEYTTTISEHFKDINYNGTSSDIFYNYLAYDKGLKDNYWVELINKLETVTDNEFTIY